MSARIPGAEVIEGGVSFLLWAPRAESVDVHIHRDDNQTGTRAGALGAPSLDEPPLLLPMNRGADGYFSLRTNLASPGSRYTYRINGDSQFPDPASSWQPDGVHAPSAVVDHAAFRWTDDEFRGRAPEELVLYELHVGAFTADGTFDAAVPRLAALADLGVTAVEVMPIAQFPGSRNWGYDGVYPYAVQSSYGGPEGFRRFVDAAHAAGLAVVLDVVYNHLGPEGNYSAQFGIYFTDRYRTPWGDAVNFDGSGSDQVRRHFIANIEHWMERYHVDGFRLDAVHEIHDEAAIPFLAELGQAVHDYAEHTGTRRFVIAESDLNDRRVIEPAERNGLGMDAVWADDFHHAVHARLTGERRGYFSDFGELKHIARCLVSGWSYAGEFSVHRGRRHGNRPDGIPPARFVFCTQNHDQIGNRMLGERLRTIAGAEADRLARSLLLLSPYIPLLFMGQEYGEERPFLYFVDHTDAGLLEETREGRKREFAEFHDTGVPPDPAEEQTLARCVLQWERKSDGEYAVDEELTRTLLALRKQYDCFRPAAPSQESAASARRAAPPSQSSPAALEAGPAAPAASPQLRFGIEAAGESSGPHRSVSVVGECVVLKTRARRFSGVIVANLGNESCELRRAAVGADEYRQVFTLESAIGRQPRSEDHGDDLRLGALDLWAGVLPV